MSKILEISGEFPCRITFFARYAPRRRSDEPEPNWGMKIRREGDAADTCGRCLMSSAHSGWSSFRVNHSLGGRESEAHGNRKAMIVSEPSSRMPPSTFSFSPLITVLTVITVVIPMTMPRMVSAERNGLTRSESIASENVSRKSTARAVPASLRKPAGRVPLKDWLIVAMARFALLRSQRDHRVEPRRLRRRIRSEEQPYTQRHQQTSQHGPELHGARQRRNPGDEFRQQYAENDSKGAANQRHRRGFDQKLQEYVAAPRPHRFPQADLAGALRHGNQHDVHDHDSANHQRDRGNRNGHEEKCGADVFPQGQKGIACLEGKIVLRSIGQMMPPAHDLPHIVYALLNARGGGGAHHDAQRILPR